MNYYNNFLGSEYKTAFHGLNFTLLYVPTDDTLNHLTVENNLVEGNGLLEAAPKPIPLRQPNFFCCFFREEQL